MRSLHELIRRVVAGILKEADAKRNLERYLETKIRKDFIEKVKIDSILNPLVSQAEGQLGHGVDGELLKEDIVDMFIDEDGGDKLLGMLLSNARDKGLEKEDRAKVVHGGSLTKELQDKVTAWKSEFGKETYNYLSKFFHNRMLKWVGLRRKEGPSEVGEGKEEAVLDEKELEKQIKEEQRWEEGLIADVLRMIDDKVDEKHRALYKLILQGRFLSGEKQTFEQLSKTGGVPVQTIEWTEKKLAGMLKEFLKGLGLGPKFDLSEKQVEIPSTEEILKNEENQKDLKGFLKDYMGHRSPSDFTMKVLDLLAEGKSISDISTELDAPKVSVGSIKNRYFDSAYEAWYKDMVEEVRKVCSKVVRVKKQLTPEQERAQEEKTEKGISKIHETLVNNALEHHRTRVTVSFSANYDNMSPASEKKQDPDFKWVRYQVSINESRLGGEKDGVRPEKTVEFEYAHRLNEDGTVSEKGTSSLKVDGKVVGKGDPLVKFIEDHLEREVLKEGAIPHGKFPVEYVNTKTGKHYHGTHDFLGHYEGILVPDPAHEGRMLEKTKWLERKRLGPSLAVGEKAEIEELKNTLKKNLKTETDEGNKRKIREHLKQLDELLEMKGKVDLDELEDIIKEEQLIRKPTEVLASEGLKGTDYDNI